jgi:hypothetical protein
MKSQRKVSQRKVSQRKVSQRKESQRKESKLQRKSKSLVKKYRRSFCNKFRLLDNIELIPTKIKFTKNTIMVKLPNKLIINNIYYSKIDKTKSGTYGTVLFYKSNKKNTDNYVLKCMFSNNINSIKNNILNEINSTINLTNTKCNNFINAQALKQSEFPQLGDKYINNDYIFMINYTENNIVNKGYFGFVLMPMGDGDLHNGLLNELKKLNLNKKGLIFKIILKQLICILKNDNLIYPDIKMEQIIYKNCKNNIKILVADLGGLQTFDDYPIITYGPHSNYLHKYTIVAKQVALFPLAVLWNDIYSYPNINPNFNVSYNKFDHETYEKNKDLFDINIETNLFYNNDKKILAQRAIILEWLKLNFNDEIFLKSNYNIKLFLLKEMNKLLNEL